MNASMACMFFVVSSFNANPVEHRNNMFINTLDAAANTIEWAEMLSDNFVFVHQIKFTIHQDTNTHTLSVLNPDTLKNLYFNCSNSIAKN